MSSGVFRFGVFEFLFAKQVAVFLDEAAGFGEVVLHRDPWILHTSSIQSFTSKEAGTVEVDVSHEERHGAAFGEFPSFVQVAFAAVSDFTAAS